MTHIPRIPRRDDPKGTDGSSPWEARATRPQGRPPATGNGGGREPAVTVPSAVLVLLGAMTVIQLLRGTLSFGEDFRVLTLFAFIPARYSPDWVGFPGGYAADVWTFVTYALLHGSWAHLVTNGIWMVAFGSAVAKRFGATRFYVFCAAASVGGAAAHLLFHFGEEVPVVGASAAVAGLMAAAARFVFDRGGPTIMARGSEAVYKRPARSLVNTLANRSALAFIGVFVAINLVIGVLGTMAGGVSVAWEAHLGGFLVGLLAFKLFDPISR